MTDHSARDSRLDRDTDERGGEGLAAVLLETPHGCAAARKVPRRTFRGDDACEEMFGGRFVQCCGCESSSFSRFVTASQIDFRPAGHRCAAFARMASNSCGDIVSSR